MLKIRKLVKKFGELTVLDNVDLELPETGLVVIKGKNGSGKTTLFNIISGLDIPTSGDIIFDGVNISTKGEAFLTKFREEYIGIMLQDMNLFEEMTVKDNLTIVGVSSNMNELIAFFHLKELLDKKVRELSGGERQRVALARVLSKNPRIILVDEPTASMDEDSRKKMLNSFKEISNDRLLMIISHDEDIIDAADICLELKNGKIDKKVFNEKKLENSSKPYRNKFDIKSYVFRNLIFNKKSFSSRCVFLMISFIFLMLTLSIVNLDFLDIMTDTVIKEGDNLIAVDKDSYFDEEDVEFLQSNQQLKNLSVGRKIAIGSDKFVDFEYENTTKNSYYDFAHYVSFIDVEDIDSLEYGRKALSNDEVVITSYLADKMMISGVLLEDNTYFIPKNFDEILNQSKKYFLAPVAVKIVGIKDLNLKRFEPVKTGKSSLSLFNIFSETIENLGNNVYVNDNFFNLYSEYKMVDSKYNFYTSLGYDNSVYYDRLKIFQNSISLVGGEMMENLEAGEVILSKNDLLLFGLNEEDCIGRYISFYVGKENTSKQELRLKVVGISEDSNIYFNEQDISKYLSNSSIDKIIFYNSDDSQLKKILEQSIKKDESVFRFRTNYSKEFERLENIYDDVRIVFIIFSVLFIFLDMFYLYIVIMDVLDEYKKEIVLLKVWGVRNSAVIGAFFLFTVVVLSTSYVFSVISFFLLKHVLNFVFSKFLAIKIDLIPFNIVVLGGIFVVAILLSMMVFKVVSRKIKEIKPISMLKNYDM